MGIPLLLVQHHHAHIASCMAENQLDENVIGISFDGTGLGDDDHIWGGEFLICDLGDYQRFTHFEYIPQPGGDAVTKHPWRMLLAYMQHYFGEEAAKQFPGLFQGIASHEIDAVRFLLKSGVNSPLTSSAGRLFDAVSALLDVCRHSTYHAEAPMRLEALADEKTSLSYPFDFDKSVSFKRTFAGMISDLENGVEKAEIAGRFHNTIVEVIVRISKIIRKQSGLDKVVLSGGSFQNRILLEKYFGPHVVLDKEADLEGLRIPHFYNAFYVYKYATGLSAAMALVQRVWEGGESEREDYMNFLKSGGSRFPLDSLKAAGVDMSRPEAVNRALGYFASLVDRLEKELIGPK